MAVKMSCSYKKCGFICIEVVLSCIACFFFLAYGYDTGKALDLGRADAVFVFSSMMVLSCWILVSKSVKSCFWILVLFLANLFLASLRMAFDGDRWKFSTPWIVSPSLLDDFTKYILKARTISTIDMFPAKFLPTLILMMWMSVCSLILELKKTDERELNSVSNRVYPLTSGVRQGGDGAV